MNPYYWTCPTCGANLDPGESCIDCHPKEKIIYHVGKPNDYQAVTQTKSNDNTSNQSHMYSDFAIQS